MADSITTQKNSNLMPLVDDLRQIINQTRNRVAVNVNAELTLMYWHIGERINREVLGNERTEYGKQIVAQVARQLQEEFGTKGFDVKSIRRMMRNQGDRNFHTVWAEGFRRETFDMKR